MGAAGQRACRERFSAERMVQDTLEVYERVGCARISKHRGVGAAEPTR